MTVEIIKTYSGYQRSFGQIKTTISYAYRCKKCELITLNKKEASQHLKCKGDSK